MMMPLISNMLSGKVNVEKKNYNQYWQYQISAALKSIYFFGFCLYFLRAFLLKVIQVKAVKQDSSISTAVLLKKLGV